MNGKYNLLQMSADIPQLVYGGETLKKINLQMQSSSEMLQTSLNLQRMMKNNPIDLGIDAYTGYDKLPVFYLLKGKVRAGNAFHALPYRRRVTPSGHGHDSILLRHRQQQAFGRAHRQTGS